MNSLQRYLAKNFVYQTVNMVECNIDNFVGVFLVIILFLRVLEFEENISANLN